MWIGAETISKQKKHRWQGITVGDMEVHAMAKGNLESSQKKNIRKAEGFRFKQCAINEKRFL